MMDNSLSRLEQLKLYAQKANRFVDLLADFPEGYARDLDGQVWYFCVPKFFYEALDIKYTTRKIKNEEEKMWTQGSWFNFSEGDKIYNHAYAYCNNFVGKSSSTHPKICLSIELARPSVPRIKTKHKQKDRYPGQINFEIMVKNQTTKYWETKGSKELSQDEFIELLIKGPPEEWDIF
jgi:hypothetical protein